MAAGSFGPEGRRLVLGTFVLVVLAGSVLFGYTVTGHVAMLQSGSITAEVTDISAADGDRIEVTFRVENPTIRTVRISSSELEATVEGTTLARDVPGGTPKVTVPSGGSATVTVPMAVRDGYLEDHGKESVEAALAADRVTVKGMLIAKLESSRISVEV